MSKIDYPQHAEETTWEESQSEVATVNPLLAELINEISPDNSFPLFRACYPYGALKGDEKGLWLPNGNHKFSRLSAQSLSKNIAKHLNYSATPAGILLKNNMELFINLPGKKRSIPLSVYKPGDIFPFSSLITDPQSTLKFSGTGVYSTSSGMRSTFMLPNIGSEVHHTSLRYKTGIKAQPAKSLYDHWHVFREICMSEVVDCQWHTSILYFSKKWVEYIHDNSASWRKLRAYLFNLGWNRYHYGRNRIQYDLAFSLLQEKANLKPNPYLADTARHLFSITMGEAPGYKPALDDSHLPTSVLQKIFVEYYGLRKYQPTIMHPTHYDLNSQDTVYYSLQNPSTFMFSPKSRYHATTLHEIRELQHILEKLIHGLKLPSTLSSDTILGDVAKKIHFDFFHNKPDKFGIIKMTEELGKKDHCLSQVAHKSVGSDIAYNGTFMRGCVAICAK